MSRPLVRTGIALLAVLPLAACEPSDRDLALDFVNTWMQERGVIDANGKPTLKGVGVATGFATTGDERVDAAVQAGQVLSGIKDTDALVTQAQEAMQKNPPDQKTANEKLDAAVDARPDDWYYRNRRAFLGINTGNAAQANRNLSDALALCEGNTICELAVHRDRAGFYLNHQMSAFASASQDWQANCPLQRMGAQSYEALANAASGAERQTYLNSANQAREWSSGCP